MQKRSFHSVAGMLCNFGIVGPAWRTVGGIDRMDDVTGGDEVHLAVCYQWGGGQPGGFG